MSNRRDFLKLSAIGGLVSGLLLSGKTLAATATGGKSAETAQKSMSKQPIVVSTWEHGMPANAAAWQVLSSGGTALDAVEQGVRVPEADPNVRTVGLGGYPDASGEVTLDACIMDHQMNCGSVAYLKRIKHPISVARKVMEQTSHVMLVGEGAQQFAKAQGFVEENLLTEQSKADWQQWLKSGAAKPQINVENHDTIGMLALDSHGNLAGACTTSGAAYKLPGRVGDSPIIGAGLYVDNEVGAATATGQGELMMKTVGCHLVVELMRQGLSPKDACRKAVERIAARLPDFAKYQVGFLALSKTGDSGAFCIQPGFNYAVQAQGSALLLDADNLLNQPAGAKA
ncbi:twin-arginine translocation signal domain-containing protein [Rheinheimera riviphila]|uniref:Twin-arginine translocation signal domain-containing protein n=1 Tax=Rheinheimera riviphila TaxID=1834037 RepID=A0A437R0E8_9GAMM|nr:N(4)-(beta-N-acetylglucosaminyl)-L-asparaginase [Rheinheimera riviphila]RVU40229.1 twin-arginine translocation signal domain-containing protein [Rheinheimera riviphila]